MNRSLIEKHFTGAVRSFIERIGDFAACQEIRLRQNRSLAVYPGINSDVKVSAADIKFTFESLCQYSVHSFSKEIREGFITVAGGHRAGFCGSAVTSPDGSLETIKNINAINFRIAREVKGVAEPIVNRLFTKNLPSVLICGTVGSGKTTVLRDLSRLLGNRVKVSLIDCRGELAAVYNGSPALEIGSFTDVFDGYSKELGIETAVRVMSPELIICDEIGSEADIKALEYAKLSGVSIVASLHAAGISDIKRKLIPVHMFDYAVFLKSSKEPAQIDSILTLGDYS